MKLGNGKPNYKRHEDDEWYDEIRITTKPRYKTSGMSGDEWRFSALVEFLRKGIVIFERGFSKIHYAIDYLPAMQHDFADNGIDTSKVDWDKFCANPGCPADGVVEYRIIDQFSRPYGDVLPRKEYLGAYHRRFCETHAKRGDCGLEDSDRNYELISAPPGWKGNADLGAKHAESPSVQAVVSINSLDDLPAAIERARKEHDEHKGTPG